MNRAQLQLHLSHLQRAHRGVAYLVPALWLQVRRGHPDLQPRRHGGRWSGVRSRERDAELEVLSGPYAGESFTLGNGTFTVGRDPKCDIFLSNMTVSRHKLDHCHRWCKRQDHRRRLHQRHLGRWPDRGRSRAQARHACPDRYLRHGLQTHQVNQHQSGNRGYRAHYRLPTP